MTDHLRKHAQFLEYRGELLEPINVPVPLESRGTIYSSEDVRAERKGRGVKQQELLKLDMLFHHYGLGGRSAGDALNLAIHLARDWVPGFRLAENAPRKRGKPKRDDYIVVWVADEIDDILSKNPEKSKKWACNEFLRKNRDWNQKNIRTIENLHTQGVEIKKRRRQQKLLQYLKSNWPLAPCVSRPRSGRLGTIYSSSKTIRRRDRGERT